MWFFLNPTRQWKPLCLIFLAVTGAWLHYLDKSWDQSSCSRSDHMKREQRNQRRRHPVAPTPISGWHYVGDSQTRSWLNQSLNRSEINHKSREILVFHLIMYSWLCRLAKCDKKQNYSAENKSCNKILTCRLLLLTVLKAALNIPKLKHEKYMTEKSKLYWSLLQIMCLLGRHLWPGAADRDVDVSFHPPSQRNFWDEVRDIGSPERTLLFVHRSMAARYWQIIKSVCSAVTRSVTKKETTCVFFYNFVFSTWRKTCPVNASEVFLSLWYAAFLLSCKDSDQQLTSEQVIWKQVSVRHLYCLCLSFVSKWVSAQLANKRRKNHDTYRGRGPFDKREAEAHQRQKQILCFGH